MLDKNQQDQAIQLPIVSVTSPSSEEHYQLRRMLLVNAGTNMHVPSGRITAIDPRGGAAVLGDNGVGKTTTLQLIPLFFGHLAGQIVAAGQGKEAMIRFVLPNDACAIVFEYDRGSSDDADRRFTVIRRRADDPDVPFYRMYKGVFRKNLFVDEGRFLTDEETQSKAVSLGIQTTSKLTPSEYRCVILRTPSNTKDRDRLRRYALEWSFGPRSLDNMDRVVAATTKKQVNFNDIVQVTVGFVQDEMGHGADRSRLVFKQGKGAIDRWLRNREACAEALRQAPAVEALDASLKDFRALEARIRSHRSDVNALRAVREAQLVSARAEITKLEDEGARALEVEKFQRTELSSAAAALAESYRQLNSEFEQELSTSQRFEKEEAEKWARMVAEAPVLRDRSQAIRAQIQTQLQAANAGQAEVSRQYENLKGQAKAVAQERKTALERSKQPILESRQNSLDEISRSQTEAFARAEEEAKAQRQSIEEAMEPLQSKVGELRGAVDRPVFAQDAFDQVEQTIARLQVKQQEISKALETNAAATIAMDKASRTVDEAQRMLRTAKDQLAEANTRLERAKARLNPNGGTLLSALRAHPDHQWRRDLAKVISQDLLDRTDLDPQAIDDGARALYGWHINTGALKTPNWADTDLAAQEVEEARARVTSAEAALAAKTTELERAGEARNASEQSLNLATAGLTVLRQQETDLKNQKDAAQQALERARRDARSAAEAALRQATTDLESMKRQRSSLELQVSSAKVAIQSAHDRQRQQARTLCERDCTAIDEQLVKLDADLSRDLCDLDAQAHDQLRNAGVDTVRLASLQSEDQTIQLAIQERDAKEGLVHAWNTWRSAGGTVKLEALRASAQAASEAAQAAGAKVVSHDTAAKDRATAHAARMLAVQKQADQEQGEVQDLLDAEEIFGDYLATGQSVIDIGTPAKDLVATAQQVRKEINRKEESIRLKLGTVRRALVARESSVSEFVEASLGQVQGASTVLQASELIACYRQMGPQVVTDVNLTLRTILASIGAFHKAIRDFDHEVGSFNRKLQEGLNEVKCFERVQNLQLDIVTNFESLGFYKKLSKMSDIVRAQASEVGVDLTKDLPSEEVARALGDFMSVMGQDGNVEVNIASCITLSGRVSDNGQVKTFKRASELQNISSEGLTTLILITLMTALLNTIRGNAPIYVPWVTDEVGKFDSGNFQALMRRLLENRIDVVTASPELGPAQQALFAHRYLFQDKGRIREYRAAGATAQPQSDGGAA